MNKRCGKDFQVSSIWSQSFFYKSAKLTQNVRTYLHIIKEESFIFFQLKVMFFTSQDAINALEKYLKLFEDKGLCRFHGENVTVAKKEIVAICP